MASQHKKPGGPKHDAPDLYATIAALREEVGRLRHRVAELEAERETAQRDVLGILQETSALVQRGVTLLQQGTPARPAAPPPLEKHAPTTTATPTAPPVVRQTSPPIVLSGGKAKQTYTALQLLNALEWNDVALIDRIRDNIARLAATQPTQEARIMAQIREAGLPEIVFNGPLRPALIDGSNIANMSAERRAHLAYIKQARRAAWAEGYFPVYIIVDASLRYQIDHPEALLAMIDRDEIMAAPPGTAADTLLVDEATKRHAILITNDRMTEWPDAKTLEKRHVTLVRGTATLGSFHRADQWFY